MTRRSARSLNDNGVEPRSGNSTDIIGTYKPRYVLYLKLFVLFLKNHLRMDLQEDPKNNIVTATFELPGVKREDVNINVHENRLAFSGENSTKESEDGNFAVKERQFGKFSRTLPLPLGVQVRVPPVDTANF